jgi:UDP-N-acetylglucosamine--N-acetylmuramyl-(pentapeptide) pyrophosphoryl-undecaprenol N-acetylglucosamine transferase
VAETLRDAGHEVTVWLCGKGVEAESACGWDGRTTVVRASGFQGGPSLSWAPAGMELLAAVAASRRRMATDRPAALLAMGSYASVGPALAARTLGIPLVLHESNAVPGRAVSFLSRFATAVAVWFEEAGRALPRRTRVVRTGMPLKSGLDARFDHGFLEEGTFTVLVIGGSQGARRLNEVCPDAIGRLRAGGTPVQAVHLAGRTDGAAVLSAYRASGVPHRVFPFLAEVGKAYNAAGLAVARAGAATCAELCARGVPSLLVPLPGARRDHQTANARALERAGAAEVMPQDDLSPDALAARNRELAGDPGRLRVMREAALRLAVPDAAEKVAGLVIEAAGGGAIGRDAMSRRVRG